MNHSSHRHLHMGCGEPLVAVWPAFNKVESKAKQKRTLSGSAKPSNQKPKDKGGC